MVVVEIVIRPLVFRPGAGLNHALQAAGLQSGPKMGHESLPSSQPLAPWCHALHILEIEQTRKEIVAKIADCPNVHLPDSLFFFHNPHQNPRVVQRRTCAAVDSSKDKGSAPRKWQVAQQEMEGVVAGKIMENHLPFKWGGTFQQAMKP